jgi:uncharacterized protein (DUF433 family)
MRGGAEMVVTVNEAAFVAGVSTKVVNQAIDREHIRARKLRDRGGARGVSASDMLFLRVHQVLAPELRRKLYQALRGKNLGEIPREIEMNRVVLNLEQPIREIGERLQLLRRIHERVETDPEVRGGEPVFQGTRTPVYAIARKIELGSPREELREDFPHLGEDDFDLAVRYAELHPRRGRPRNDWTSALERIERR